MDAGLRAKPRRGGKSPCLEVKPEFLNPSTLLAMLLVLILYRLNDLYMAYDNNPPVLFKSRLESRLAGECKSVKDVRMQNFQYL